MDYKFRQQQELNRKRDAAMGTACTGLTTRELEELNPNLIAAAPDMYEALKEAQCYIARNEMAKDTENRTPLEENIIKTISKAEGKV